MMKNYSMYAALTSSLIPHKLKMSTKWGWASILIVDAVLKIYHRQPLNWIVVSFFHLGNPVRVLHFTRLN